MESKKMLIACIVLCLTAHVVEIEGDSSQFENDFSRFIGTPLNYSHLSDNTNGVQLYLRNESVDFSAIVVDDTNVNLLNSMLRGRTVFEFLYVASKLAAIEAVLSEKTGERITTLNFEDIFSPDSDSVLDSDAVDEIYREVTSQSDPSDNGQSDHSRTKRKATAKSYKWSTTIPYIIKSEDFVSNIQKVRDAVRGGIKNWEDGTCLNFTPVDKFIGSHIIFEKDSGCWSKVGRQGPYGQPISLGSGCETNGIVAHEIGHALGLRHEHERPDRDQYVSINYQNIKYGKRHNFEPRFWDDYLTHGTPYDYSSIMHYRLNAFSRNREHTISVKENDSESLPGSGYVLSFYDAKIANYMYCADQCPLGLDWSACQNGGYRDPKDCRVCRCPDGWSGTYCSEVEPAVNGNCGGELVPSSTWATLTSPNYESYARNLDKHLECTWRIKTNEEKVRIVARFTDEYRLPCTASMGACRNYVELRNQDMGKSGQRHCCNTKPRSEIVSHGKEMMVLLRLDAGYRSEAFRIEYRIEPCGCSSNTTIPSVPACLDTQTYSCPGTYNDCRQIPCIKRERKNTCYRTEKTCCGDYKLNGDICTGPMGSWSEWSSCSTTCGSGTKYRSRPCNSPPCSESLRDTETCMVQACPSNGAWSSWGNWTSCSVTCGSGTMRRSRTCSKLPCSGTSTQIYSCYAGTCPSVWSEWSEWAACSKTCGTGSRTRARNCLSGSCWNSPRSETELCNKQVCNDGWSSWFAWSGCSKTCGSGYRIRNRSCYNPPCSGSNSETKSCNQKSCGGQWSTWNSWTSCSKTCGSGSSYRWRSCSGYPCSGQYWEEKACNEQACQGQWSTWNPWTSCSKTCGSGSIFRWRNCSSLSCGDGSHYQTKACNLQTCNAQGSWSTWTPWTSCSRACGTGFQLRTRECSKQPCVGSAFQGNLCFGPPCTSTGSWSTWSTWGSCSKSCGSGTRYRTRTCSGANCSGSPNKVGTCNTTPC